MTRRPSAALQPLTADAYHTTADAGGDGRKHKSATDASDYQGATLAVDRQPENRCRMYVDAAGYAVMVGGWYGMEFLHDGDDSLQFLSFIRETRDRYPLDPADIVMPDGWTLDADGSAVEQMRRRDEAAA